MEHIPVLAQEIIAKMQEMDHPIELYFDGTFGRGGHVREMLGHFPRAKVIAMDRDQQAIEAGKESFASEIANGQVRLIHNSYQHFSEEMNKIEPTPEFDFMLLDLGVSSPQLDVAERGFSFYHDGPLDMRMDQSEGQTAAQVVNEADEDDLIEIFRTLGEIPRPFRVVRAVVHDRDSKPFNTTRDLASLIERVEGWSKKRHHPATRYFMALRLHVNQELEQLERSLPDLIGGLKEKGRLAVLTFHSLEDRIVKNYFRNHPELGKPVNKKVIVAKWDEQKKNPRARSAKLRVFEKGASHE